jgi:hypothetical protein
MPGRIEVFATGSTEVAPDDFALASYVRATLSIVVSMKSTSITVSVLDLPNNKGDAIALLVPVDRRLTLRESCYSSELTGAETVFQFVPTGKYRILIFDSNT